MRTAESGDDCGVGTPRVSAQMKERLDLPNYFLWTHETPERHLKVRQGEILVAPLGDGCEVEAVAAQCGQQLVFDAVVQESAGSDDRDRDRMGAESFAS